MRTTRRCTYSRCSPRRTALYRATARGATEPVVANLTQLLVVLAPLPLPDLFVVDRYLAAATAAGIAATLVVNKSDLGVDAGLAAELAVYAAGRLRARSPARPTAAPAWRRCAPPCSPAALAALVGQSGVGKSSLVRRLVPAAEIAIGELVREEEGRHTTTAARLYDLPNGAALIDSPGVRDFAPAVEALDERSLGFIEVERLAPGCRFADCRHMREPGCAVQAGRRGRRALGAPLRELPAAAAPVRGAHGGARSGAPSAEAGDAGAAPALAGSAAARPRSASAALLRRRRAGAMLTDGTAVSPRAGYGTPRSRRWWRRPRTRNASCTPRTIVAAIRYENDPVRTAPPPARRRRRRSSSTAAARCSRWCWRCWPRSSATSAYTSVFMLVYCSDWKKP